MTRPLPSEFGCATGFAFAGSGLGAFIGCMIATGIIRMVPDSEKVLGDPMRAVYKGLYSGMFSGILIGAVTGILYAQAVRRKRARNERERPEMKDSKLPAASSIEPSGWEKSLIAAENVRQRMRRAARALDAAGLPYAVAGGNAVAEWVERKDEGASRNTRDVDLLINRHDLPSVKAVLESIGFINREWNTFADGEGRLTKVDIRLLFAGECFNPVTDYEQPTLDESERFPACRVLRLDALVRMKLAAHRRIDQVHLLDMIGVGLIDASWPDRFPPPLGDRLQALLDDPDG